MTFACRRLRFFLRARDALYWPAGKAGNVLRGALGTALDTGAHARLFAPRGAGPSGLAEPPRPFVLRAAHLDGRRVPPGEAFHFDVHLFDLAGEVDAAFRRAFAEVCRGGIGPGRGSADLEAVEPLPAAAVRLDEPEQASRVEVRFVTPTELKCAGGLAARPEFAILFARLRDRLSTLRALYGPGPLEIDFRAAAARAAQVRMTSCQLAAVHLERRSSRTGQTHPLGGFFGTAAYEGALGEFLPYLRAGQWTGVGRQTVWGKGELQIIAVTP